MLCSLLLLIVQPGAVQECKHLGIQGRHPAAEIQRLPAQLPQLLLNLHATHITSQQVLQAWRCGRASVCTPANAMCEGHACFSYFAPALCWPTLP